MSIKIYFSSGDNLLQGRFHQAAGDTHLPTLILLHGSPGNEEDVLGLGAMISSAGYQVLTFNYSGTQKSEGLSSFDTTQQDIEAAYNYLRDNRNELKVDTNRLILGGWSYGGGMALTYAANHPDVNEVFSISGTDHGEFMQEYWRDDDYREMVDEIFAQMQQPDSPWRLAPGATPAEVQPGSVDLSPYDLRLAAPRLADRRILLIGGWDDVNVKIDNHILPLYRSLRAAGADDVTMVAFQDDHGFATVRRELANVILEWMAD